jgi:hypothetical protein
MSRIWTTALSLVLLVSATAGCYHTIIESGLPPGPVGYQGDWETGWIVGIVPAEVDATAVCGGPWSRVETQQSFLNGLVSMLTLGIYAPHEVTIVCAAGGSDRQP